MQQSPATAGRVISTALSSAQKQQQVVIGIKERLDHDDDWIITNIHNDIPKRGDGDHRGGVRDGGGGDNGWGGNDGGGGERGDRGRDMIGRKLRLEGWW